MRISDWSSDVCSSDLHAVGFQVLEQLFLEDRIVVAVVQGACAAEEVDVLATFLIDQDRAARLIEYHRKRPDVATYLRLHPVKDFQVHRILPSFRELTDTEATHARSGMEPACVPVRQAAGLQPLLGRQGERAYLQQHLVVMVSTTEQLPVEKWLLGDVRAQFAGQAGEGVARRLVVRPDRGFKMTNMLELFALQEFARSVENTSALQSLMRISYAVF